jgi:hypothetical protein
MTIMGDPYRLPHFNTPNASKVPAHGAMCSESAAADCVTILMEQTS